MNMVMKILEGQVAPEKWPALEQAYQEGIKQLAMESSLQGSETGTSRDDAGIMGFRRTQR